MTTNTDAILNNINSWASFKNALQNASNKEKGDAFEQLTKKYLTTDPTYTTKLKHVWLLDEVPTKLRLELNLPETDKGIDLIAQTHEGEYWAIQSKYRENDAQAVTWRELSTFTGLAFGICKNISFGLLCTSGDRYTDLFKGQENIGICSSDTWQELDSSIYTSLAKPNTQISIEPYVPRPHQQRAINNAKNYFSYVENTRGKFIMPCGAGKSLTAHWIAEALGSNTVLVAVPSLALLRQTYEVWLREYVANNKAEGLEWLCVCSDSSIADASKDDVVVLPQDLGIPCTTNEDEIAIWFTKTKKAKTRLVFTTYQSGKVIAKASKNAGVHYDLGIMDEAHKTVGQKDALFSHLLFDSNIDIAKRVFMTATERRYAGSSDEIVSMDDQSIYGDTFELLSFKEALEQETPILSDYKILTVYVSKQEVLDLIQKNRFIKPVGARKWDEDIEAEMMLSLVALKKAQTEYPIQHVVSFHSSIARAKAFKVNVDIINYEFDGSDKINTFHVTGATPTIRRQRELNEFKSTPNSLITNARCLTEGVDVPNIDCVLFADPKKSTVDIVQAVGRALRPSKGKQFGYVLVPVMVDKVDENFTIDELNAFAPIMSVLRALASNDERIVEQFKSVSEGRTRTNGPITDSVFTTKVAEKVDINTFMNNVDIYCWNKLAKLSWLPFDEAREFVRSLKLSNYTGWQEYCSGKFEDSKGLKPANIPTNPHTTYKENWVSYGDWTADDYISKRKRIYRTYDEAKEFVHELGLSSRQDWIDYTNGKLSDLENLPDDIPASPWSTIQYKDKYTNVDDWLGRETFPDFSTGRKFARNLKLTSGKQWVEYVKSHTDNKLPIHPDRVYKDDWLSWSDWLGNGYISTSKRSFYVYEIMSKMLVNSGVKSKSEFYKYLNNSTDVKIPSNPPYTYKKQWLGWPAFLGTSNVKPGTEVWLSFDEAREKVVKLNLKSESEWRLLKKGLVDGKVLPPGIPANPNSVYKSYWKGWAYWLGKK